MRDFKDLLERTVEDIYAGGGMSDAEYEEAVDAVNDPDKLRQLQQAVPSDVADMWQYVVDEFHNGNTSDQEYLKALDDILDQIEYHRKNGTTVNDAYDRAMKGI